MKHFPRKTLLALTIASLTACGGGGGGGSNGTDANLGNNNVSSSAAMNILETGMFEYDLYNWQQPSTGQNVVGMDRHKLSFPAGKMLLDSQILLENGWRPLSEYEQENNVNSSRDLILTPNGWVERATDEICNISPDRSQPGALLMDCQGNRRQLTLSSKSLAGKSVKETLLEIADDEFDRRDNPNNSDNWAYQAIQSAVQYHTATFPSDAAEIEEHTHMLDPELVTLDCAPEVEGQPVSEWTCNYLPAVNYTLTSTNWEDLESSRETFSLGYYTPDDEHQTALVYLAGDLSHGNSGAIVVADGQQHPGLATQWDAITIHGQRVILLTPMGRNSSRRDALINTHGQMVRAFYIPAGTNYEGNAFNASASASIDQLAEQIFPLPTNH